MIFSRCRKSKAGSTSVTAIGLTVAPRLRLRLPASGIRRSLQTGTQMFSGPVAKSASGIAGTFRKSSRGRKSEAGVASVTAIGLTVALGLRLRLPASRIRRFAANWTADVFRDGRKIGEWDRGNVQEVFPRPEVEGRGRQCNCHWADSCAGAPPSTSGLGPAPVARFGEEPIRGPGTN
jgi:hypothetical protein